MHDYYILLDSLDKQYCKISDEEPEFLNKESWKIMRGISVKDIYPENIELSMFKKHPGKVIPDLMYGISYYLISQKLKNILEKEVDQKIEYLPFTLINCKGKQEPSLYYILNVLDIEDCVDLENSKYRESHIAPGTFSSLRILNLEKEKINPELKIFRIKQKTRLLIIRDDLKNFLESNNITGLEFVEMGEKTSIF
ncbi:MAG: hypothetical protein MJB14_23190 [Spirochaetes bacterium]|nr:hypothetical protein [Spirochaetota bacterium]